MKITLEKLSLVNFQGKKSLDIEFGEVTTISGRNKLGKTTVKDAFLWLAFGKDSEDRKDFGVKTWDENGIVIPKIDHEVTGILNIDGVKTKLSRILKEKWVKKRGEETTEFTGNETYFFINDVPKSQAEYQNFISGIIPEATFKLLTSPDYFSSLKWDVRREMLISIAGAPTNEEIASNDLISLLSLMETEKKSIEDLKKEYSVKKKKLKESLDQIPTRIDENHRDTPEAKDFVKIEAELNQAKHNQGLIDAEISDLSKGTEEVVKLRSEKVIEKNRLENKVLQLENEARNQFANAGNTKDSDIRTKQQRVLSLKQSILNYGSDNNSLQLRIDALVISKNELKERYEKRNAETLEFNAEFTCPTCGQSLPDDLVSHKETEAIEKFNSAKVDDINLIVHQATENKKQVEQLQATINDNTAKSNILESTISELSKEIETLQNTPVYTKSVEAILNENSEYVQLKADIEAFKIPEIIQPDSTALRIQQFELKESIALLEADLRIKDRIAEKTKRKGEIEVEGKQLSQQIASLEKIEFQIETFNKRKMTSVESRVNSLFPTLKFRMFNQTIEGNDVPACDCLIEGVPYPKANSAGKINAGIEIINVFSKAHNCFAPVFVDFAESINQIIPTQSQLIRLVVTTENELTVTI